MPRIYLPAGREILIGHNDGSEPTVVRAENEGRFVDVPADAPTLDRPIDVAKEGGRS